MNSAMTNLTVIIMISNQCSSLYFLSKGALAGKSFWIAAVVLTGIKVLCVSDFKPSYASLEVDTVHGCVSF